MDFDFTDAQQTFRREVREWLARNVPDDLRGRGFAASRGERHQVERLRDWQRSSTRPATSAWTGRRSTAGAARRWWSRSCSTRRCPGRRRPSRSTAAGFSMLGPT